MLTARGYEFVVAINLIPSDTGPRNDHHPVRFRLRSRDLTSIVHRSSHIDLRQAADRQNIAIEDVIKALEEAKDAGLPMSFQEFEGGTHPVIVRYLEFHDGETALKPTDKRVRFCPVIAEEPFPERGG